MSTWRSWHPAKLNGFGSSRAPLRRSIVGDDWLNDGAKGYLVGLSNGPVILSAPGIEVRSPSTAQLLAMKLSAWRDDLDVADAGRLLDEMTGNRGEVWREIEPYLIPGDELKAQYAFADLWEGRSGKNRRAG